MLSYAERFGSSIRTERLGSKLPRSSPKLAGKFGWGASSPRIHKNRCRLPPAPARRHPMEKRIPASMRTRQSLSDLIEGRLSSPDGRGELVKLATRLIVEEALEAESRDAIGRGYYEHGARPGQGYRNGSRPGRLKTAEGLVEYAAPQIAGREEPFRSEIREHLKG